MNNADMPAMPVFNKDGFAAHPASGSIDAGCCTGLTKRETFAMAAMQGLLGEDVNHGYNARTVAKWSVEQADALLEELENTK